MMKYSLIDIICLYYYNSKNIFVTKYFSHLHTDEEMINLQKFFSSSKSMKNNPYKTNSLITFLFIIILALPQFKSVQAETRKIPWQMFRGDIQHTGQSIYKGPQTNNLKWSFQIDTRITSSPSIGSDGTIYVGSIDGRLYAINPDGTTKWAFQVGNEITASPAIGDDGTIYVGSRDKKMYAITPEGKPKWTFAANGIILSSAAVTADALYFGSDDNTLYVLTLDGKLKWKFTAKSNITASPTLWTDGTVYLFETSGAMHALSPDGMEKWVKRVGTGVYRSFLLLQ